MKTKNDDDHRDNHFDGDDEEEEDADKDEKDSDSDLYEVMPKKIRSGNHRGTTKTESNEMSTFLDGMAKSDQTRILKMQEKNGCKIHSMRKPGIQHLASNNFRATPLQDSGRNQEKTIL